MKRESYLFGLIKRKSYKVGKEMGDPNPIEHIYLSINLGKLSIHYKIK